uniref:Uncharacterized protein n=1 Tax=Kalanchoe fedtschenkoi TaxID=63787 RepID=A0A7N0UES0_KALFE
MDRAAEKDKSRDHRDSATEDRHRRERKHRDDSEEEEEEHHKTDKHRDSDRRHRRRHHRSDKGKRDRSRERDGDRDYKREGSRDRDSRRERSPARVRDESRSSHKRKDRGGSEECDEGGEKKVRVSDREEKRERRREEDKDRNGAWKEKRVSADAGEDVKDVAGGLREERRRFKDEVAEEVVEEGKKVLIKEDRRGKRKFEDGVKEEPDVERAEAIKRPSLVGIKVKEEPDDEKVYSANDIANSIGSGSAANGAAAEPHHLNSKDIIDKSFPSSFPPSTKVSSITTTNENKGVNNNSIHEVPGKSSTDGASSAAGKTGNLSLDAIAKAKKALQKRKEIEEKMKKLPGLNRSANLNLDIKSESGARAPSSGAGTIPAVSTASSSLKPPTDSVMTPTVGLGNLSGASFEAVKRAQELAAKMGFRKDPEFAPLINLFPGQLPSDVSILPKPAKAPVLRLDALGREIDEQGNVVNITKPSSLSTLKVNINKHKKDAFQILKPELDVDPDSNPYYDPHMGINKTKLLRPKRMTFQFVEEGKWSKEAEHLKLKSQFGEAQAKELKAKQAQYAKAKAELDINPNLIEVSERVITKQKPKDPIPETEWWDVPLLVSGHMGDIADADVTDDKLKIEKITIYVEHPRPIEPPAEPAPPPPQPLKLTKKEQKKLRTQRRLAREKERQEMIRQGLLEPPKPKVKMSNLMKVLGSEATQDPTKLEMEIRSAAAEREQAHVDRNIARKLTPAERREKKERKLFDDPNTVETLVSVYKIIDLSRPQMKFKVEVNAKENRLTGCTVITNGMSVVVVEGGNKSIKRYGKLMLKRINWAASVEPENDEEENEEKPVNKCVLVWQGSVAKPNFTKFSMHNCLTEAAAKKVFSDSGVVHYWEMAVNFSDEDQV